jgi:hypothetical protein
MVYTQMLFALAGDRLVFGVTPGMASWVGSVLILAGAIWVAAARDKDEPVAAAATSSSMFVNGNVSIALGETRPRKRTQEIGGVDERAEEEQERVGLMHDNDNDVDDRQ